MIYNIKSARKVDHETTHIFSFLKYCSYFVHHIYKCTFGTASWLKAKLVIKKLISTWMGAHLRAGKLSQYVTSHPGQLNLAVSPWVGVWVPAKAGKVTIGLASHWPCVTDNSGLSTYGLIGSMVTRDKNENENYYRTFSANENRNILG